MAITYYDSNAVDTAVLEGRTIAVLGYGNQGRAHAQNLRDSGLNIVVGARASGTGCIRARHDGFKTLPIDQAVQQAELIIVALPDDIAPAVYRTHIGPRLCAGKILGFIHGYNIHYGLIAPPGSVDVIMVAPKGAGYMVREAYRQGCGVACLVAVAGDASPQALPAALAWAHGIGGFRSAVMSCTFASETETDLFGEQACVVGGVSAIVESAFQTLVDAGYEAEHAYLECVHELKFVVDLIHDLGLEGMREKISSTATFGATIAKPRLAQAVAPVMRRLLEEIRSSAFTTQWQQAQRRDRSASSMPGTGMETRLEQTGAGLRKRMASYGAQPRESRSS